MPLVNCPICDVPKTGQNPELQQNSTEIALIPRKGAGMQLEGILTCLKDGHKMPIRMRENVVTDIQAYLPVSESAKIIAQVPAGIVQDVQEAERAHLAVSYKACVVMCRRAMQLSLIERHISDMPLGRMIEEAKKREIIKSDRLYMQAMGIKDYGDAGAHRTEELDSQTAALVVYVTVQLLNEVFQP